jgi:glycosidase
MTKHQTDVAYLPTIDAAFFLIRMMRRGVRSDLGTMDDLRGSAKVLRGSGISLVVDFVFDHTHNEHKWTMKAAQGDPVTGVGNHHDLALCRDFLLDGLDNEQIRQTRRCSGLRRM